MIKKMIFVVCAIMFTNASALNTALARELIVFESENCTWCKRWDREVFPVYETSPEGRQFPLRRVDINEATPSDLATIYPPNQTPTFIVIDKGREYGRIVGYPGARRFWDMLRVGISRTE